jgi:hypothetical protein
MFTSNHSELSKPLFNLLNKNQQQLINNVPEQWRNDAAAISRITSFDLYSPMAQFALNRGKETFEPGNLVGALLYYYKFYQYSGDEAEMKNKIFPLLKRSVNYLMHLLYKDEKGMSAEKNHWVSIAAGCRVVNSTMGFVHKHWKTKKPTPHGEAGLLKSGDEN